VKRAVAGALSVGLLGGLGLGIAPGAMAAGENITFIQGVKGDGFYITMNCGVKAAAKKAGAKVKTVGPEKFDATLQKPILDAVIASKPDAILIAPNDVKAMQKPLEKAKKAGIEVVLVDTTVNKPKKVAWSAGVAVHRGTSARACWTHSRHSQTHRSEQPGRPLLG
jgi:ribose transport system substrate-binding protein